MAGSSWYILYMHLWCNAAERGLIGHQLATAWVKVLRLCLQMTNEADLLEATVTLVVT